jgi:hypothetical protein
MTMNTISVRFTVASPASGNWRPAVSDDQWLLAQEKRKNKQLRLAITRLEANITRLIQERDEGHQRYIGYRQALADVREWVYGGAMPHTDDPACRTCGLLDRLDELEADDWWKDDDE